MDMNKFLAVSVLFFILSSAFAVQVPPTTTATANVVPPNMIKVCDAETSECKMVPVEASTGTSAAVPTVVQPTTTGVVKPIKPPIPPQPTATAIAVTTRDIKANDAVPDSEYKICDVEGKCKAVQKAVAVKPNAEKYEVTDNMPEDTVKVCNSFGECWLVKQDQLNPEVKNQMTKEQADILIPLLQRLVELLEKFMSIFGKK